MAAPSSQNVLDGFDVYRQQILSQPWIQGLWVGEVREYLAGMEDSRFASLVYETPHPYPYLQPRGGFPTFKQQKALSEALDQAGADFIPLTIDSYTRHNDYGKAAYLLSRSEEEGKNYLNGYPLVNQGYELSRQLYTNINKPVSLRHGTPDARLLVETAVASGITDIEGGALTYCLPYSEGFPVDRSILYWQYVDRVCADYSTSERPINRESFGVLTATMVPPMMTVVIGLVELLLAAEQGVKSFAVGFGQTGSLVQDMALGRVLLEKCIHYLRQFGFDDVNVYLVYHQWMGAFPMDREKSGALIALSAVVARLVAADKIVTKTKDEAFGIPTPEANCEAVQYVRYIFEKFPVVDLVDNETIAVEADLIGSEVDYVMETIFDMRGDVFWESVYQAFRRGFLDVPFAPHRVNPNKLLTVRDRYHAIRIKDPGMVPMRPRDLKREQELLKAYLDPYDSFFDKAMKDIYIMV